MYDAICVRLGDTLHIPDDYVETLFNDMKLYPSEKQGKQKLLFILKSNKRERNSPRSVTPFET